MKGEIVADQLQTVGFKQGQLLRWGEGRIGINNVVSFTNESQRNPLQRIPARFLAGFIPTFLLAEQIQVQTGSSPTVRIFFPKNIAHSVNGIDSPQIDTQIHATQALISALQKTCFPSVALSFQEDQPIGASATDTLRRFSSLILEFGDKEVLETIQSSAHKHGSEQGENNSALYLAHHPFGWQEAEAREIFDGDLPDIVINTLPPSERRFLSLRRSIREKLHNDTQWKTPREIHDIEMNIAGAHYLLLDEGEPTLQDLFTLPVGEILGRMEELKKSKNDNLRKARNDFDRLVCVIAQKTHKTKDEILKKTLSETLEVEL